MNDRFGDDYDIVYKVITSKYDTLEYVYQYDTLSSIQNENEADGFASMISID